MKQESSFGQRSAPLAAALLASVVIACSGDESTNRTMASDAVAVPATRLTDVERAARIAIVQQDAGPTFDWWALGGQTVARARQQRFVATLEAGRLRIDSAAMDGGWSCGLEWTGIGRSHALESVPLPLGGVSFRGNRASLRRSDGMEEWYLHGPLGLEQGFMLSRRPAGRGVLHLQLTVEGTLTPRVDSRDATGVELMGSGGVPRLRYTDLYATDARGRALPVALGAGASTIDLFVDDAGAAYPLVVDPLLWVQQAKLLPSDGGFERFGNDVALQGDTAIVGASGGTGNPNKVGQAYVMTRAGSVWSEQQKLTSSDGAIADSFGRAVAVDGDTVIVGAPFHDQGMESAGAAYAFHYDGTSWSQQQKLVAANPVAEGHFGASVDVAGDTAAIGAFLPNYGPRTDYDSVHVFVRNATTWTEQQALTAADQALDDAFPSSVSLNGDTLVVGAPDHTHGGIESGAAYVFVRNAGVWTQQQELLASDPTDNARFGLAVALSGDSVIVGARVLSSGIGAAYVFVRTGGTWTEQQKLTASDGSAGDAFGWAVGLDGDTAIVGAIDAAGPVDGDYYGAAYLFTRAAGVWSEDQILLPADGQLEDWYGSSVAVSGTSALVGAPSVEPSGAAYVHLLTTTGEPCTDQSDCEAGWCVDGVCCDLPCGGDDPNDCLVCSQAAGAAVDGVCGGLSGSSCDDGLFCNGADICSDGLCTGATGNPCPGPDGDDDCRESCDEERGACVADDPDESTCPEGVCLSGSCIPDGVGGAGGSAAGGNPPQPDDGDGEADGGCGCRLHPAPRSRSTWPSLVLALVVLGAARRRTKGLVRFMRSRR